MVSPLYAANNIIIRAKNEEVQLSHLKLQKLLYMLYAHFLAKYDASLFSNRFEAWQYGPVLTEIYDTFKKYGSRNITELCKNNDSQIMIVAEEGCFKDSFDEMWRMYGGYSGSALVSKTHEKDSAWYKAVLRDKMLYGGFLDDEHIKSDGNRWFGC